MAGIDPDLDAALADMARARKAREIAEKKASDEALLDEAIAVAMDLGAMRAQDGALKLTDKLTELRRQLLERLR